MTVICSIASLWVVGVPVSLMAREVGRGGVPFGFGLGSLLGHLAHDAPVGGPLNLELHDPEARAPLRAVRLGTALDPAHVVAQVPHEAAPPHHVSAIREGHHPVVPVVVGQPAQEARLKSKTFLALKLNRRTKAKGTKLINQLVVYLVANIGQSKQIFSMSWQDIERRKPFKTPELSNELLNLQNIAFAQVFCLPA